MITTLQDDAQKINGKNVQNIVWITNNVRLLGSMADEKKNRVRSEKVIVK